MSAKKSTTRTRTTRTTTTAAPAITIAGPEHGPVGIPVSLVGESYTVYPPKTMQSVDLARQAKKFGLGKAASKKAKGRGETTDLNTSGVMAVIDSILGWVSSAFPEEEAERVNERLNDATDALDIDHVTDLMSAVTEYATQESGNPTT